MINIKQSHFKVNSQKRELTAINKWQKETLMHPKNICLPNVLNKLLSDNSIPVDIFLN